MFNEEETEEKHGLLQTSVYLFSHLFLSTHINMFSVNKFKQTKNHFFGNVKYY